LTSRPYALLLKSQWWFWGGRRRGDRSLLAIEIFNSECITFIFLNKKKTIYLLLWRKCKRFLKNSPPWMTTLDSPLYYQHCKVPNKFIGIKIFQFLILFCIRISNTRILNTFWPKYSNTYSQYYFSCIHRITYFFCS